MKKSFVLESVVNDSKVYFERLSVNGFPLNDTLKGAKRFSQLEAIRIASRLNAFMRQWPNFTEEWLYKVVAIG